MNHRDEPMRPKTPRNRLPQHHDVDSAGGFSHQELIDRLRAIDGLHVGHGARLNFTFRSRPFLHFHQHQGRTHADVKFGTGDFEAIPASTPDERRALLDLIERHVRKIHRTRKGDRLPRRDR